jgi:hypothetical protein
MPVTPSRHIRLTDVEWSKLAELGRQYGPEKPLNQSDVIRVLIRKATEKAKTSAALKNSK